MQVLFTENVNPYNLRNKCSWERDNLRTVKYGTETVRNMGPKTWEHVSNDIKQSASVLEFRAKIKSGDQKAALSLSLSRSLSKTWSTYFLPILKVIK